MWGRVRGAIADWFADKFQQGPGPGAGCLLTLLAMIAFSVVVLAWNLSYITRIERECLDLGYSAARVYFGPSYCVTRENGTDIVVPLDTARLWGMRR
jgi:hypothetical protein